MRTGFDHDLYTRMQSEHIRSRIAVFGGKLYLELGGKLFDDFHASRVLSLIHISKENFRCRKFGTGGNCAGSWW